MKTGIRKLYMANGGSWDYQERINSCCNSRHGRCPKDKNLSKRIRRMCKYIDINNEID